MAIKLNERAYDFARELVRNGRYVIDGRDDWSEHQPSTQQQPAPTTLSQVRLVPAHRYSVMATIAFIAISDHLNL